MAQVIIRSRVTHFTVGFVFRFFPGQADRCSSERRSDGGPRLAVCAGTTRTLEITRPPRGSTPCATTGGSRTTITLDTVVSTSAIPTPRRQPREPPGLTEAELSRSRSRHASSISMRQAPQDRASWSQLCVPSPPEGELDADPVGCSPSHAGLPWCLITGPAMDPFEVRGNARNENKKQSVTPRSPTDFSASFGQLLCPSEQSPANYTSSGGH
jgi:hypothetical protein